eukprot:CAMPEP_0178925146 /NCGR_PEP_ID=MMETSP0786-20121207/17740_1 /TAXON_ID=186022 /ORGANISM="Thalassionema frauenfeldii, Strain CCMP 1798" /LENGTH=113 /DNA_ID=CAMNT_0020599975 /DNA_START=74 /DNA_END=411 /DNA_ORIENTATION=-
MYVSITGLRLRSIWHYPQFGYHAMCSKQQAEKALGNLSTQTTSANGIQHTLTVWKDRDSMIKFMASGAHAKAMKITSDVASFIRVYGYETDKVPTWEEAIAIWAEKGRDHGIR